MKKLVVLLPLLLAGCGVLTPPPKYIRPYTGKLTVKHQNLQDTRVLCRNDRAIACAVPAPGTCIIFVSTQLPVPEKDVMQHELAHCLGWPGTHPQG